jgi:signal transduction histidine kinase
LLSSRELCRQRRCEPLDEELATLKGLAEEALAEARGAVNELAPARLRQEGLTAYLEDLVRQFQQRAAVPVAASIDLAEVEGHAVPLPEPAALLLIGLLREGLNNIRKHAHARQVSLTVARSGDRIHFRLADDGAGFHLEERSPLPQPTRHYGLAYLRERVAASGGELRITSRPGEGTLLEARLPLLAEERLTSLLPRADE